MMKIFQMTKLHCQTSTNTKAINFNKYNTSIIIILIMPIIISSITNSIIHNTTNNIKLIQLKTLSKITIKCSMLMTTKHLNPTKTITILITIIRFTAIMNMIIIIIMKACQCGQQCFMHYVSYP